MTDTHPAAQPHGGIEEIFADAFFVTGSVMFKPLVRLVRNMVILRDGEELTLVNAVRLNGEGEAALNALGKVKHVVRIGFHGMDDGYYVSRYQAKYWSVPGSSGPESDATLSEDGGLPVSNARTFMFRDTVVPEAAILLERGGGLLITCDSIQHWAPHELLSPAARLITRLIGFQYPAQIGPPWRKKQTPPGGSLKSDFERLEALPFNHIIGGHGGLLRDDAKPKLRETIERVFG